MRNKFIDGITTWCDNKVLSHHSMKHSMKIYISFYACFSCALKISEINVLLRIKIVIFERILFLKVKYHGNVFIKFIKIYASTVDTEEDLKAYSN